MQRQALAEAEPARKTAERVAELARKLELDIELARLPPGELLSFDSVARRLRCLARDLPPVLEAVARRGLLKLGTDAVVIAELDRDSLGPLLERRLELELIVIECAARRIAPLDENELANAAELMTRSALIGDIEGFIEAGRRHDHACFTAADLPALGAEITAIKNRFRRAWCAYNRLRDLTEPAAMRRKIGEAVRAGEGDRACAGVRRYFDYLRHAY